MSQFRHCVDCKHYTWDMDGNFCANPEAIKKSIFGKTSYAMHIDEICTTTEAQLFEEKESE